MGEGSVRSVDLGSLVALDEVMVEIARGLDGERGEA